MNNDPIEEYVIEMLKKITPEKKILITERFKTFKEMGYDSGDTQMPNNFFGIGSL